VYKRQVGGNTIILNSEVTGSPTSNATIIVNRGNEPNVYIRWDETINEWVMYEAGSYPEGHILHSEKTAHDWADYTAMPAYEKLTHPIGASLANATNEHAKAGYNTANTGLSHALAGYVSQNTTGVYANTSYLHANSAYISQNTTGVYANSTYRHANAAYISQNTTGVYANTAHLHANAAYVSQNTTGVYANTAYLHANAAYSSQNTTGVYANAAYNSQNTTGIYANTALQYANSAGSYANSSYARANVSLVNNADTSTSGIIYAGGIISNTTVTVNTSAVLRATSVVATAPVIIDTWDVATYGAGKYFIKMEDTGLGATHAVELIVIEAGGTSYISEYGEVRNSVSLGSFDATISGGTLSLTWTPSQSATTLKMIRTLI
jgi:hypothetical protein